MNRNRLHAILYLALAVTGIIFLAASLPDLQFQAGLPIPGAETTTSVDSAIESRSPENKTLVPWLFQGILALCFIVLLFALVIAVLRKVNKKRIGLAGAILLVLFVLLSWLPRAAPAQSITPLGDSLEAEPPSFDYAVDPIGEPPAGLFWLVVAGLVLCGAVTGTWLLVLAFRQSNKENPLGREASTALQAIEDGQNLRNVIIRCYLQMESVVKEEQGIKRETSVTAREFENHLAARGISRAPVRQLTRLFEKARYGNRQPSDTDEREAVECLTAIRLGCLHNERG